MRFGEDNDLNRLGERKREYVCVSKREREKWGSREIEREGEKIDVYEMRERERERERLRSGGRREMDQGEEVLLGNI